MDDPDKCTVPNCWCKYPARIDTIGCSMRWTPNAPAGVLTLDELWDYGRKVGMFDEQH